MWRVLVIMGLGSLHKHKRDNTGNEIGATLSQLYKVQNHCSCLILLKSLVHRVGDFDFSAD